MVTVWLPNRDAGWTMPAAEPHDNGWIEGGRRTMHELAVAIACTGRRVEFRGEMSLPALEELSEAAGVQVELPSSPRRPDAADTVIVNEGVADPRIYARLALSPARRVLMVLAPLGMFGWPFVEEPWSKPDYDAVETASLSRPEHFAGAAALGFELWSHTPAVARVANVAGVSCELVGRAQPTAFPAPAATRDIDVLMLERSHWPELTRQVQDELASAGVRVVTLPVSGRDEVLEFLGRARVFAHPARTEANPRIVAEARAMGAVPVVLNRDSHAVGTDQVNGCVCVASVDDVAGAVGDLLGAPERLELLASKGIATAAAEGAWQPYVERIDKALDAVKVADVPGHAAHAGLGAALRAETAALEAELAGTRAELERHRRWLEDTNSALSWRLTRPLRSAKRRLRGR